MWNPYSLAKCAPPDIWLRLAAVNFQFQGDADRKKLLASGAKKAAAHRKGTRMETNSLLTQFQHVAIHQDNFTDRSPDYQKCVQTTKREESKCLTLFAKFAATQMGFHLARRVGVDVAKDVKGKTATAYPQPQTEFVCLAIKSRGIKQL